MRVLIISTNREKAPFAVAPIGAAHLIPPLEAAGHPTELLDLCFSRFPERAVAKTVRQFKPQLIGISMRNLDNCMYGSPTSYHEEVQRVITAVKGTTAAPIVIGGSGVSVLPHALMAYLDVSCAVVGEGETSLPAIAGALETGGRLDTIPGVIIRQDGRFQSRPPDFATDVDSLSPYAYDRIDYQKYFKRGGFVGLQTKRGCNFSCVYCNYRTLEGARIRRRSPGRCVDDIQQIVSDTGLRDFFFTDSVFNWPRDHALEICEQIVRRRVKIRWMAYCNPAGFDQETATLFKASGCAGVELGLDAVTDEMLENMGKGFGRQDISRTYAALTKTDIPFAVFLLFGGPGDSYDNMVDTQRLLSEFGKANAVFASIGIRIYPDAPIHQIALDQGVLSGEEDLLTPVYYLSPRLGEDIIARLDRLARQEATWSTPTDWNSRLVSGIQNILGRMRVIPNWRDIETYGKHFRRS